MDKHDESHKENKSHQLKLNAAKQMIGKLYMQCFYFPWHLLIEKQF